MSLAHIQPDHRHSILNLLTGIRQRFTASIPATPYPALSLPGNPDNTLLLLVIDGLGADYLSHHPDSFLARHRINTLSTVFPSTTASAMTSYLTGAAPQQHAITGWFTWFREIGCITAVLPFTPRFRGPSLTESEITPQRFIGQEPLFDALSVPSHIIYPDYIVDSDYTRATSGKALRHGHETMEEMFATLMQLANRPAPRFLFAYWSQLDALAHRHGIGSGEVAEHFTQLDNACRGTFPQLAAKGVDILACADHGLIDTDPAHLITLEEHPALQAMLTLPLCGEPRAAFCYVHAHRREDFEAYISKHLSHACECRPSEELIDAGYFGPGAPHPELHSRCGDYTLLMKQNFVIKDHLITEKPFHQIGVHGGLSRSEMQVPLIAYPVMHSA